MQFAANIHLPLERAEHPAIRRWLYWETREPCPVPELIGLTERAGEGLLLLLTNDGTVLIRFGVSPREFERLHETDTPADEVLADAEVLELVESAEEWADTAEG